MKDLETRQGGVEIAASAVAAPEAPADAASYRAMLAYGITRGGVLLTEEQCRELHEMLRDGPNYRTTLEAIANAGPTHTGPQLAHMARQALNGSDATSGGQP
jgi:hypothetical protein